MAAPAQQRPTTTRTLDPKQAINLLDQILDAYPNERIKAVAQSLEQRIARIEEVLPPQLKGQGARLARRAVMTLARNPSMSDCPAQEFVRIVLEAAELGLAIDGKLCHVVRFKSTWVCMPDYKGLLAVARRSGSIADAYADVVCQNDDYRAYRQNGQSFLRHEKRLGTERGEVIGAYAIVHLPSGEWRFEEMQRSELDMIQRRAPAQKGPWLSDRAEMQKKTVLRRALKLYSEDPAVLRTFELMEQVDETPVDNGEDRRRHVEARMAPAPAPEVDQASSQEPKPVTKRQLQRIAELSKKAGVTPAEFDGMLSRYQAEKADDLSDTDADDLERTLHAKVETAERQPGEDG